MLVCACIEYFWKFSQETGLWKEELGRVGVGGRYSFLCVLFVLYLKLLKHVYVLILAKKKLIYKNSQKPDYSGKHSGLKLGFINDNCSLFFF